MSGETRCAIWNTIASGLPSDRDGDYIDSPRAGGRYFISERAKHLLIFQEGNGLRFEARLTSWLVEQRRLGIECPEILERTLEEAEQFRGLTAQKRADLLLRYISNHIPNIGDYFELWRPNLSSMAMAWSESSGMEEVRYLLRYLMKRGWLEEKPISGFDKNDPANPDHNYRVSVEGYARLAELDKTYSKSSQAFVAMWFDPSMVPAWEQGIKPGIEDAGYESLRIDQKQHGNKIDDEIISEIRRSRFVFADFTHGKKGARGGVYYEAGFAHGLNVPVIFACRKDKLTKLHFDTRQYPHIVWEKPEELRQALSERISAVVGDGPLR